MTKQKVLSYHCTKCGELNKPYGESFRDLPHSAYVKCNKCDRRETIDWNSPEAELLRLSNKTKNNTSKELKLEISMFAEKIKVLETGRDSDRKEIQLLRQLIDLAIQKDITELKSQFAEHEHEKNFLQGQITKLNETLEEIKTLSLKDHKGE